MTYNSPLLDTYKQIIADDRGVPSTDVDVAEAYALHQALTACIGYLLLANAGVPPGPGPTTTSHIPPRFAADVPVVIQNAVGITPAAAQRVLYALSEKFGEIIADAR